MECMHPSFCNGCTSNPTTNRFRWVALQLDELENRCLTFHDIKTQLDVLPKDLEKTYERILSINPRRRELLQLLHWLAFSVRALSLTEFAEVISVDLQAAGRPRYNEAFRYADASTALTVCAGLISETDGKSFAANRY